MEIISLYMSTPQKMQKQFYNRAQHQLREIQFSCRQVITLSQTISLLANDINQSQINCKKIQFLKNEIKQKLKEFSNNVDQVYKILDRKILILASKISKELKEGTNTNTSREHTNSSLNKTHFIEKESQNTNERSRPFYDQERMFSDTLNPRVVQLQAKIAQHLQREAALNTKIRELKQKNEKLLEQFTLLSTVSNKKINQLNSELKTSRQRDNFSMESSKKKQSDKPSKPELDPAIELLSLSANNRTDKGYDPEHQYSAYVKCNSTVRQDHNRPFAFGCMPINNTREQNSFFTLPKMVNDNYENLDKQDKHRRFDLLLSKLRYSEEKGKSMSNLNKNAKEEFGSVFAKDVLRKYQM